MNSTTAVSTSLVEQWRAHCQQHPQRFVAICGTQAVRKRIDRWEEQLIEQLTSDEDSIDSRAVVFRALVELRQATARDVATFFGIDPRIVVVGLSLLPIARPRSTRVSPAAAVARDAASRIRAA